MIKFDDAFEIVTCSARRLGTERVELGDALNRVLAEDVISDVDCPSFNKSAMDGYACRRADLANELTVLEMIPAGRVPAKTVGKNQCAEIATGAVVPDGADCVIMVEHTEVVMESTIRFTGTDTADNICLRGEDVREGDVVLRTGRIIRPQHIAVLATHGCVNPLVSLQPRVGIIATGSELVEPANRPAPGQLRNSNGYQLAAQAAGVGVVVVNCGIAADTKEATDAVVKKAMAENDVVILSGGVSVGRYDLVRAVLEKNNVKLLFDRIAAKPGRPTVFGVLKESQRGKPVSCFGLPGNPVSSFVMFELLVKPFLYKIMGHNYKPPACHARLEKTITRKKTERDCWLPVAFAEDGKVTKIEYHGSAHINALCEADGLICIPKGTAEIKEGADVAVRQI